MGAHPPVNLHVLIGKALRLCDEVLNDPFDLAYVLLARQMENPKDFFDSQLATLEPLGPDEPGMVLDFERGTEALVAEVLGHYRLEGGDKEVAVEDDHTQYHVDHDQGRQQ